MGGFFIVHRESLERGRNVMINKLHHGKPYATLFYPATYFTIGAKINKYRGPLGIAAVGRKCHDIKAWPREIPGNQYHKFDNVLGGWYNFENLKIRQREALLNGKRKILKDVLRDGCDPRYGRARGVTI